jgi:hypothetical protein
MKIEIDYTSAILFLFFIFWMQSGWYRIDCGLMKVEKACHLIEQEYVKKERP